MRSPAVVAVVEAPTESASRAAVMALLRQRLGSRVEWAWTDSYGSDGQFGSVIAGVALPANVPVETARLVLGELRALCAPARADAGQMRRLLEELTRTLAVTVSRERKGHDDELAVDTMLRELGQFPADCVLRALGSWQRNDKWRPSLAELLTDIRWRANPRMRALAALEALSP